MRTRAVLALVAHVAICCILGCVFLGIAVFKIGRGGKFGPILPFHTTNSYLLGTMKAAAGSERILDLLSGLPTNKPIAIVYRDDEEADTFIAFSVMYFAWPRSVQSFPVRRDNAARQLEALKAAPVSATFFCGVWPPPQTDRLVRISDAFAVAVGSTK